MPSFVKLFVKNRDLNGHTIISYKGGKNRFELRALWTTNANFGFKCNFSAMARIIKNSQLNLAYFHKINVILGFFVRQTGKIQMNKIQFLAIHSPVQFNVITTIYRLHRS